MKILSTSENCDKCENEMITSKCVARYDTYVYIYNMELMNFCRGITVKNERRSPGIHFNCRKSGRKPNRLVNIW